VVMCECYGAIKDMPVANLYKEAMDQFAKGINLFVPHAVWYDAEHILFPPELSYRSPLYGPELPAYNRYMGRLQRILQHGEHVADIGVLYPIATLQAGYRFGVGKPYTGGIIPAEADYMAVGDRLMLDVRHDFTFVHPAVLDERCTVEDAVIRLAKTRQRYRVFILPGSTTMALSTLRKIKTFYDRGGQIIATTRLPVHSAEFGQDAAVQQIVREMFGEEATNLAAKPTQFTKRANAAGGTACFTVAPTTAVLRAMVADALPVPDVAWEQSPAVGGGNLSYIHKVLDGRDVFFFGNSSDTPVATPVRLRGRMQLEWWDPHTGKISSAEYTPATDHGQAVTRVKLTLPPVRSCFLVGQGVR
jgi:hypothetical protein